MVKPFVVGGLATALVGVVIVLGLYITDASGDVGVLVTIIGACIAGLIGAEVARHLPPPKQPR
jgi:uncharacterized membrane protein YfcA